MRVEAKLGPIGIDIYIYIYIYERAVLLSTLKADIVQKHRVRNGPFLIPPKRVQTIVSGGWPPKLLNHEPA